MWSGQAYLAIFLVTESLSCRLTSEWLDSTLCFSTTKANTAEEEGEEEEVRTPRTCSLTRMDEEVLLTLSLDWM